MTWLIASLAVKTGIAPMDLLRTPRYVLEAMVEIIYPKADVVKGEDAWQALASMATE